MARLFPFKDLRCNAMQRGVVEVIRSPEYLFKLPELSDDAWMLICNDTQERERLEFLGDALIGAFISEELFRCRPSEGPGFYTSARQVLTANSTFAHLMHKTGFHNINDPVKPAGDAFETIIAAYHHEHGPVYFQVYLRHYFQPLIEPAAYAYNKHQRKIVQQRKIRALSLKTARMSHVKERSKLNKRQLRSQVMSSHRPPGFRPDIASNYLHPSRRLQRSALGSRPTLSQKHPIVIDLTIDDQPENGTEETLNISTTKESFSIQLLSRTECRTRSISPKILSRHNVLQHLSDNSASVTNIRKILRTTSVSPKVLSKKSFGPTIVDSVPWLSPLVPRPSARQPSKKATDIRDELADHFMGTTLSGSGSLNNPIVID